MSLMMWTRTQLFDQLCCTPFCMGMSRRRRFHIGRQIGALTEVIRPRGADMAIRWMTAAILAVLALAAAGVARADLVDPATGNTAAGTTDALAAGDEVVDSPAAFDDRDNAIIADALAAESGARVTSTTCLLNTPTLFRKVVRAPGQIVATPSGNLTIVCHGRVQAPQILVGGAPSQAIVVQDGPCFFGKRPLPRSQLVITPSLNVTFVCHDNTA
jgi:hypothetical protein